MPLKKTELVQLRLTPEEKAAWKRAAENSPWGLSKFIRVTMNQHIGLDRDHEFIHLGTQEERLRNALRMGLDLGRSWPGQN